MLNKIGPKLDQKILFQKLQTLINTGFKLKMRAKWLSSGGSVEYTLTLYRRERYQHNISIMHINNI